MNYDGEYEWVADIKDEDGITDEDENEDED